jgi:PAS domain S-box-containing protein
MDENRTSLSAEKQFKIMAAHAPVLLWISGTDQLYSHFNEGWLIFTGRTLMQETGNGWTVGIHPDDLEHYLANYTKAFDSRQDFKLQYRLKRHDGSYRWLLNSGVPRYEEDGSFAGYTGSCTDINALVEWNSLRKEQVYTDALEKVQDLNEQLIASNEKMAAANEELTSTIEELQQAKVDLSLLNEGLEEMVANRVEELANTVSSLRSLVMTAHYPLMILRGREWIIEIANQPLVNLWEKTIIGVTGHPLMEILPEIEDQPFPKYLRQVYDTGIGFGDEEQIFYYNSPTGPAVKYVSYYYDPMLDDKGEVCGLIVAANDITEMVKSRQLLEKSYEDQQSLNEEFATINEELATTIDELSTANDDLAISEERFRSLIRQAPVGICVIRASDLMVQEVNDEYLELVGKSRADLEKMTLWQALADLADSYAPILQQVIETGKTFVANEHAVTFIREGIEENVFVDFVYEPVKNAGGSVTTIMVVVIDVTLKVLARKSIEDGEQRVRLAVEAAEIGTFEYIYTTDTMVSSDRFNHIFGLDYSVSRAMLLGFIHPDDRHLNEDAHKTAAITGKLFYETRIVHLDGSLHWVRVQGNIFFDSLQPYRLLGTLLDITEFKHLQQQKDDFISIASHELKTPLTGLKASLQLLDRFKNNLSAPMVPKLIEQSGRSMNKISELVDDLLNVSRMNGGQIELKRSTFTVADMLNDCCSHVRAEGKFELIFEGDKELEVFADEHRTDQVVVNFVSNAVKYAPDSKEIHLSVERVGNMARIAVRDYGPGIPAAQIPHLFSRYYRAENAESQVSGLGLGLYICADIISRHGGEIGVDSELGKGSTFWFTLPLKGTK